MLMENQGVTNSIWGRGGACLTPIPLLVTIFVKNLAGHSFVQNKYIWKPIKNKQSSRAKGNIKSSDIHKHKKQMI